MKKTLLIIVVTSILSSLMTVSAIVFLNETDYLGSVSIIDTPVSTGEAEVITETPELPGEYLKLEKIILTVNGRHRDHLILIELAVETHRPELYSNPSQLMPVIQNHLLHMFGDTLYEDIVLIDAIARIEESVKDKIEVAMLERGEAQALDQVMVTSFIVQ